MIVCLILYLLFMGGLLHYLTTRIRYEIDDRFVCVVWLGSTVRKIALSDIKDVHTKFRFWNEHWCNTLFQCASRRVTIDRKSGLIRHFIITPANRDAFIAELRTRLSASRS
jgi:hypothetical protein